MLCLLLLWVYCFIGNLQSICSATHIIWPCLIHFQFLFQKKMSFVSRQLRRSCLFSLVKFFYSDTGIGWTLCNGLDCKAHESKTAFPMLTIKSTNQKYQSKSQSKYQLWYNNIYTSILQKQQLKCGILHSHVSKYTGLQKIKIIAWFEIFDMNLARVWICEKTLFWTV